MKPALLDEPRATLGDVHKAAAQIKGQLPGRGVDAEKEGKKYGQEAGAKIDAAVSAILSPLISLPR